MPVNLALERMNNPLSIWDRFVYGCISAAFGALFGLGAALFVFLVFHNTSPVRSLVLVSAAYFAAVGAVKGPDAGFMVGDALSAAAGAAAADAGEQLAGPSDLQQPSSWQSPALLVIWGLVMAAIAWKG
jgi:hypothetical protein